MGRSITCNYQVQVETPDLEGVLILGAMRYEEAKKILQAEARRIGSTLGYIWPQTARGKARIEREYRHQNFDYLKIQISEDAFKIEGVQIGR